MESRKLRISTVRNFSDTNSVPATITWEEFVDSCRSPVVRGALQLEEYLAADKAIRDRQKDGCAIIAGTFCRPGTRRAQDMTALSMVVLDLDDGFYPKNSG